MQSIGSMPSYRFTLPRFVTYATICLGKTLRFSNLFPHFLPNFSRTFSYPVARSALVSFAQSSFSPSTLSQGVANREH